MNDILPLILLNIDNGADWKVCRLISRQFAQAADKMTSKRLTFASQLSTVLLACPGLDWTFGALSKYAAKVTARAIRYHMGKWHYGSLCSVNPHVTYEMVREMQRGSWSNLHYWYSYNPGLTWDIVERNLTATWSFDHLVKRDIVTWDIYCAHRTGCFARCANLFVRNPNCTLALYLEYAAAYDWTSAGSVGWYSPVADVLANPTIEWDFAILSKYAALADIAANPQLRWQKDVIAARPDVDWDYFTAHLMPGTYSANPNATLSLAKANPGHDWDLRLMARHLSAQAVEDNRRELGLTIEDLDQIECTWVTILYIYARGREQQDDVTEAQAVMAAIFS